MKKLLMATDLSAHSDRAMERALDLAREGDAELTILHVIDGAVAASQADTRKAAAVESIRDQVAKQVPGEGPSIAVEAVFGTAHARILEMAETTGADLLVFGAHREDAFKDMFRGTTAERVIRAGARPVLLVKDRASGPYRRVIVGVDFSDDSRRAVEFAVRFVPRGEFSLVHAYDVPFKGFLNAHTTRQEISKQHETEFREMVEGQMASFLENLEPKAPKLERIMQEGTVREVMYRQQSALKSDLLVIGTHGRTGVAHAFLGSVAEDLLRDPPCDVLAVKTSAAAEASA